MGDASLLQRILLVDPDEADFNLIRDMLLRARDSNFTLEWASSYEAGRAALKTGPFDAIIIGYDDEMDEPGGVKLIHDTISSGYPAPVLVLTGSGRYEDDIEALQAGAIDYLDKDEISTRFLERSIRYAIERKRMEKELDRQIQDRLDILESIQDGFFAMNRNWQITYINQKAAQNMDLTVEALLGKNILETFPSLQNTPLIENYRKVMNEGVPIKMEMRGVYKGQWYSISIFPTTEGISVYWQDITDRVRAEEALREAHDRAAWLARFPDESPNPVARITFDGWVLYCNSAASKALGLRSGRQADDVWQSDQHQQVPAPLLALIREAVDQKKSVKQDVQLFDRFYSFWVVPFFSEQFVNLYGQDVTERKQAEEAQRQAEERFRIALSNTSIAVFSTDQDLRYTWFYSTAMGSMLDQFLGKRDDEILPLNQVAHFMALKRRAMVERTNISEEIRFDLGPKQLDLIVSIEPYYDGQGELIGVIGACFDVTEQRRLEYESIRYQTEKEVQRRLNEYREKERQEIARDLHDGPVQDLSSLIFSIQVAKEAIQDPAIKLELEQIRASMKETVHDLRSMINDLRPPSLIRFGVNRAIQFHIDDFREKHPELKIELKLNPLKDEARLPERLSLTLYRIYQEAMTNIVRHAQATRIKVLFKQLKQQLVLEIQDNGKGFPISTRLIEHTESQHFGLAGMKERAEAVGGQLNIFSEPGKGTKVQVTIPFNQDQ